MPSPPPSPPREILKTLSLVGHLGFAMVGSVALFTLAGYSAGTALGWKTTGTLVGMLAGVGGGFSYCSKKILAAVSREPGEEEHQPQMDTNEHEWGE